VKRLQGDMHHCADWRKSKPTCIIARLDASKSHYEISAENLVDSKRKSWQLRNASMHANQWSIMIVLRHIDRVIDNCTVQQCTTRLWRIANCITKL